MAGKITPYMVEVRQGDSFDIIVNFKDQSGNPMDIHYSEVKMQVRSKQNTLMFSVIGDNINPEKGVSLIKISPNETSIPVDDYNSDIQVAFKNGDVHTIWPQDVNKIGLFRTTKQITE